MPDQRQRGGDACEFFTPMIRSLITFLACLSLQAAGPVRVAFDATVASWNYRCATNSAANNSVATNTPFVPNSTQALIASSVLMGGLRSAGLYPGTTIQRLNGMCGTSYGGVNGAGSCTNAGCINIASPGIPLIADIGSGMDVISV